MPGFFGEEMVEGGERDRWGRGGDEEFGAIAGGDDDCFRDAIELEKMLRCRAELSQRDGEFFPHFDRCSSVIEAEAKKLHQI